MKKRAAIAVALAAAAAGVGISKTSTKHARVPHGLCSKRPAGAPVESCLMRVLDGGAHDQGDENVMEPERAVGPGCVATACRVMQGERP